MVDLAQQPTTAKSMKSLSRGHFSWECSFLLISGFLGVAFFAPHWLESEPSDPYDEDY